MPNPKEQTLRASSTKTKHAISLVDQAAKSLCEIWHPYDIPAAFLSSSGAAVTIGGAPDALPRPAIGGSSITTRRSPTIQSSAQSSSTVKTSPVTQTRSLGSHELVASQAARSNEVPMKSFVHELCRRSRTSGMVLQTALCYLEALRSKVPQLVRVEMEGKGVRGDPDLSSRITTLDDSFSAEAMTLVGLETHACDGGEDLIATIKVLDDCPLVETPSQSNLEDLDITPTSEKPNISTTSSSLPSPLLCPRRAFVASLILATKFTQDRCYSNRAWGKLCGLPPREIGRCERALGDALEWRLWVGKKQPVRTFGRSQSEGTVLSPPADGGVWAAPVPAPSLPLPAAHVAQFVGVASQKPCCPTVLKPSASGLRRSTTAPNFSPSSFSPILVQPIVQPGQQPIASTSTSAQFQQLFYEPEGISPVPSLSHSPSSTESSDGDQTIQMSTFFGENMISNMSGTLPKAPFDMDSWSWTAQVALSMPSAHPIPPVPIPHAPHKLFLPKAMMDDAAAPSGIIPEPMVGILEDGYKGTGDAFCGQEEAFVTYGGGAGMAWDHSLVY